MVHSLYWISALTFALVLIAIYIHDGNRKTEYLAEDAAFHRLLLWMILFCVQDAFWGLSASDAIKSRDVLFFASVVFHSATVLTTLFWLKYVLTYLGALVSHPKRYLGFAYFIIAFQAVLLIMNFFTPTVFFVGEDYCYHTAYLRPFAFANQYIIYFIVAMFAVHHFFNARGTAKKKFRNVIMFALAQLLSGVFQYLYPDGPFYSIGYFLGTIIIHVFIVSTDRDELRRLHYEKKMSKQIELSYTDSLTGLSNRRAFEADLLKYPEVPAESNFTYLSIDLNGLKNTNDNLGHDAGDEIISGAAECLRRSLGSYGKIYRIGGDEFAAIIFTEREKLRDILSDLERNSLKWQGKPAAELSLSVGAAAKAEFPDMTVTELIKIADKRMYNAKAEHYSRRGIDRRGQQSAFAALCASYAKVLKVNLTDDSFRIIFIHPDETSSPVYSEKIFTWLHEFGCSGQVYTEDVPEYLAKVDPEFLREYFHRGKNSLHIFYHRRSGDIYRQVMMEMIPAEDYSDENQNLYLLVKDIDK